MSAPRAVDRWASTPVRWATTTAAIGIVVTLVAAPHATRYAAAAGVALVVLVLGVQRLVREQRAGQTDPAADRPLKPPPMTPRMILGAGIPDESGQDPDPIRTDPDTTPERAADQAGHDPGTAPKPPTLSPAWQAIADAVATLPPPTAPHPDAALRGRVAAAILARIKQATITRTDPLLGQIGSLFAATEYDLADVVLAELAPELARAEQGVAEQRAATLCEAADFVRDAHFHDGLTVQEIGTAIRHWADRTAAEGSAR